ncbi:hypothetical protein ACHAXS_002370 [Conticribra weissflogii]
MTRTSFSAIAAVAAIATASAPSSAFLSPFPHLVVRHHHPHERHQPRQPFPSPLSTIPLSQPRRKPVITFPRLFSSTADQDVQREVQSMRVGAIKAELESYGINTKQFLEKSELVEALVQARKEGKTPMANAASSPSSASSSPTASREEEIAKELSATSSLRISQLKSELEDTYGINTKQFLEKKELARALAEARVDDRLGIGGGSGNHNKKKKKRRSAADEDEVEEVTAAKVEVITSDDVGPKKKKGARDAYAGGGAGGAGNPFAGAGAGGSPFGAAGGGNPFGGMGGMGGMDMGSIADMLKNMGGGMGGVAGAPGGNPFAGAGGVGGNPFAGGMPNMGGPGMADAMKKAQEAMNNPKVRAVMAKAQQNPKVMKAVQESMGNPMAMAKYMNDPDVGPILRELQEAMM